MLGNRNINRFASRRVYPGGFTPANFVSSPHSVEGRDEGKTHRRGKPGGSRRSGVSLTEVMVAMMVALIGVFGVFVLIPFAVRQVEIGMNLEAAQTLGRNGMSDFDAQGYQNISRWAWPELTMPGAPFYQPVTLPAVTAPPTINRQFFCIDPWGWTQQGLNSAAVDPSTVANYGYFPYFTPSGVAPARQPQIPRLSLFDRSGVVFSSGLARRMFSAHDDVVTEAPSDDFSGPSQQFFVPDGGRQYAGRLTWQMFVVQESSSPDFARFYSVVSLRRAASNQDRLFKVTVASSGSDYTGSISRGGDVELTEISRDPEPNPTSVRRGAWIMLIQQSSLTGTIYDIGFYRVLESDQTQASAPRKFNITLQGSDLSVPPSPPSDPVEYFAVMLPDTIAVYERTMKYETSSDWSLN